MSPLGDSDVIRDISDRFEDIFLSVSHGTMLVIDVQEEYAWQH